MTHLFQPEKGRPGRKRTVTARAWISRKDTKGVFYSNISLGRGRVQVLSTDTRDRDLALRFNATHLISALKTNPATAPAGTMIQQEFHVISQSA